MDVIVAPRGWRCAVAEPDWIARGLAAGSFLVAGTALYFSRFDGRWKRRHAALQPIRAAIRELEAPLSNPGDHMVISSLFTPRTGSNLDLIEEGAGRVPDRRLKSRLESMVNNVKAIRSSQAGSAPLTPPQMRKVEAAKSDLAWVLSRMDKAAQRGVA